MTPRFMRDPLRILVKKDELTLEEIRQLYLSVEREEWKLDTMCDLYALLLITQEVNTGCKVDWLTKKMHERDLTESAMHVTMDQKESDVITTDLSSAQFRLIRNNMLHT